MQPQPLRSQAVNWQIDPSQNRSGEFYGQAFARAGSMLGNAILEHAKEREEKEKKKKEEEAAAQFLTQQGYFKTPEEAKVAVKGIGGPEKVMQFMQIDQQKKLMEERAAALAKEKADAEAKAMQAAQENAILKSAIMGGSAPGSPPPFLARNGTPEADMSGAGNARRMVQMGMPGAQALKYGEQMASAMPKPEKPAHQPRVVKVGGIDMVEVSSGNFRPLNEMTDEKAPGSRPPFNAKQSATVNGKTYDLVFDGTRWVEAESKQPWITKDMYGNDAINPMFSGATSKPPTVGDDEQKPSTSRFSIRRVN